MNYLTHTLALFLYIHMEEDQFAMNIIVQILGSIAPFHRWNPETQEQETVPSLW